MASRAATPPYPSADRIADSLCFPQYTASLKYFNLEGFVLQVWKNMAQTRVNVKNILMFTRNVRKKREKLDWNVTRVGPSSREIPLDIFFPVLYGTENY
ncbi:hypothetical protein PTKIN_Ptkin15bG0010500 [Pterospermum kingtungense]